MRQGEELSTTSKPTCKDPDLEPLVAKIPKDWSDVLARWQEVGEWWICSPDLTASNLDPSVVPGHEKYATVSMSV